MKRLYWEDLKTREGEHVKVLSNGVWDIGIVRFLSTKGGYVSKWNEDFWIEIHCEDAIIEFDKMGAPFYWIDPSLEIYELSNEHVTVSTSTDIVNSPTHYCKGGTECIEVIKTMVTDLDPFSAVCVANIVKYLYRFPTKNGTVDLRKAENYLKKLIEHETETNSRIEEI